MNTVTNDLAHELWAIAQGKAAIEDVVRLMEVELHRFAEDVEMATQEACVEVARNACEGWNDALMHEGAGMAADAVQALLGYNAEITGAGRRPG